MISKICNTVSSTIGGVFQEKKKRRRTKKRISRGYTKVRRLTKRRVKRRRRR